MYGYEDSWKDSPAKTGIALIIALVSPVGAPLLGLITVDGWVFEVPADLRGRANPVPLKALGRFNHEAAAVDPRSGIVYLTEDRDDSLFYRFLPNRPGRLAEGGRLQALALADGRNDSRTWTSRN